MRQIQIKQLARLADERWASKPSLLDKPQTQQQPGPATRASDATVNASSERSAVEPPQEPPRSKINTTSQKRHKDKVRAKKDSKDPWAREKGAPSENWQPESWTPAASWR